MRCSFALSLIFILFSSNILEAKPRCDVFYDRLKNDYSALGLENEKITKAKTFGFDMGIRFETFPFVDGFVFSIGKTRKKY